MSTLTPRRRSRLRAGVAAAAAAGLTAAGLSLVPGLTAPAQASAASPELTWKVSGWFDSHLGTHSWTGGVTESEDGVLTFRGGERRLVEGVEQVEYDGSVTGAFVYGGTRHYSVTIADPVVVIDGAEGAIKATVSATVNEEPDTPAAQVTLTTFDASAATGTPGEGLESLVATPRWADVLQAADAPEGLLDADKPLEGKSWDISLLSHLPKSLRAHFHKTSTSASQETKAPAEFTAEVPDTYTVDSNVTVTTTSQGTSGATIRATGTGFVPPVIGDFGIYVVVGVAGGRPEGQSAAEGIENSVAAGWLAKTPTPGATGHLDNGAFTLDLSLPAKKLVKGKKYAVYTFPAHSGPRTYETETPISISWDKVFPKAATTAKIRVVKAPTTKARGKIVVTVKGGAKKPSGKVRVTYGGGRLNGKVVKVAKNVRLNSQGAVTVVLPKSARGKRTVKVRYLGDSTHKASATVARTITVKKR
ncbi:Htaa protein [Nocardioides sp. J9]|uniref:HtaA domain-containing protein n=1 Tax=Nocardioides sp. J9 TaxID=935844 RepID=UPI0011A0BCAE|nr:Ig-like domain repeat protein [Nocardioides sp. J9]TWH04954.1 Htaa protein [Nocardioides sp. J9]